MRCATDPTVDKSRGAALLAPFAGRAVNIRAWASGDQWIGTSTAPDAEEAERPVLVVAQRAVPQLLAVAAAEDVDRVQRLTRITGWPQSAQRPNRAANMDWAGMDWAEVESRLGVALPSDYKRMVETFGEGSFDGYLGLNQEPWTDLREDGLLIWASTEQEDLYCWRAAEFVCRILIDPHHRYTMARHFDTHWFMSYRESG